MIWVIIALYVCAAAATWMADVAVLGKVDWFDFGLVFLVWWAVLPIMFWHGVVLRGFEDPPQR